MPKGKLLKEGFKVLRTTAKKAGSKKAADTAIRKQMSKELTDLGTPASTAATKSPNMGKYAKSEMPEYKKTAYSMGQKGKALKKKEDQLQAMRDKADSMSGTDRIKYLSENKEKMDMLKSSIKDMKRRDIVAKKGGGPVDYSTSKAKPKKKPTSPEDMGAVARGNRMAKMEAGARKAMNRKAGGSLKEVPSDNTGLKNLPSNVRNKMGYKKAGGSLKKKGYKSGGSVSKPRGVGCAMRGYGKAM